PGIVPTFDIAPGVQPGVWVFAPKGSGMSTENFESVRANPLLRLPAPVIRVEQGDIVQLVLENTHYFPHSIHLHGVDHPFMHKEHGGGDGVPQTSEIELMPGERRVYEFQPRQAGTMFYHCHVQTHTHLSMGLAGMIVVEENRPNNWLQTLNIGGDLGRYVYVINGDNTLVSKAVTVGNWLGKDWIIETGLNPGDRIVIDNLIRLAPNKWVEPRAQVSSQLTEAAAISK
ncbi:MAG TPA: multicopper oxidase domain-containing protein, partial [Nitrosomonas sp.]|nr:multicopper oxidase domain-containing protein [Nitrosomonas sp.]